MQVMVPFARWQWAWGQHGPSPRQFRLQGKIISESMVRCQDGGGNPETGISKTLREDACESSPIAHGSRSQVHALTLGFPRRTAMPSCFVALRGRWLGSVTRCQLL